MNNNCYEDQDSDRTVFILAATNYPKFAAPSICYIFLFVKLLPLQIALVTVSKHVFMTQTCSLWILVIDIFGTWKLHFKILTYK